MSKFDGALAKVARAEQHLDEVDRLGKAWAETVSYELRLELGGPNELVGRLFNPGNTTPPRRLALAFGDVVHNLRSALDHLVRASGRGRSQWREERVPDRRRRIALSTPR